MVRSLAIDLLTAKKRPRYRPADQTTGQPPHPSDATQLDRHHRAFLHQHDINSVVEELHRALRKANKPRFFRRILYVF